MNIYKLGLRPLLFSGANVDPEWLHQQSLQILQWLAQPEQDRIWLRQQLERSYHFSHPGLTQTLWGLKFDNPIGLAAGFDKDGVAAGIWSALGFGFAELGTVTRYAQPGNPQPRLFRLPADQAALNRMGFNNQGAAALSKRLTVLQQVQSELETDSKSRSSQPGSSHLEAEADQSTALALPAAKLPIGINLGKSKITPIEAAAEDYLESFQQLQHLGDYFVVNVSSPNTPGLRSLQDRQQLEPLLRGLQQANTGQKPILVKIAPDLEWSAIEDVIDLALSAGLAGIIATNTTISRENLQTKTIAKTGRTVQEEAGGISGAPLRSRSTQVIEFIHRQTQGKLPIIGVGGIFSAIDAWEKIAAGASLVQVYTGWIYEGPGMARAVLQGLVQKLQQHQMSRFDEAIGCGLK